MEIGVISKEFIRPSSLDHKSPFKISHLDQLVPSTYSPVTLFYPCINTGHSVSSATHRLKTSLSQTLTSLYPLSGRLKDNLFVDNFDQGVPFIESRVRCKMSHFLQHPQMEWLNRFLPCSPFAPEPNPSSMPQMAVQVNIFDCGGIAIGLSLSHKLMDAVTVRSCLKSWAAVARGEPNHTITRHGNVLEASSVLFPPIEPVPHIYEEMQHSLWFGQGEMKIRRYVFSAEAIAALRTDARSDYVTNPTRNEAVSSFIWKSVMSASTAVSGSSCRLSALFQAVNIRPRAKPRISDASIGNMVWPAVATTRSYEDERLPMLVKRVRQSLEGVDTELINSLQRHTDTMLGQTHMSEDPERLMCTSWLGSGFDKIDFGWGMPVWVGAFGEVDSKFMNLAILKSINASEKGIEAWVSLRQDIMDVMEKDPDFLPYTCINPPIISSIP